MPKAACGYARPSFLFRMIYGPPLLEFLLKSNKISEESEGNVLYTRYFRKKGPLCNPETVKWIEMSGGEYYQFIIDPKNKGRLFVDMSDVVLEVTAAEASDYKAEMNHNYYIRTWENGWSTVSLYAIEGTNGYSGEEVIVDQAQDVEAEVLMRLDSEAVRMALSQLDTASYFLIYALYLAKERKTVRQFSQENHIPVITVGNRKQRILKLLKNFLKFEK